MSMQPPPLPSNSKRPALNVRVKLLLGVSLISTCLFGLLVVLRILGLICPYSIPHDSMAPAVSAGDHVLMENFTFHFREPRRGDIIVFKSDRIEKLDLFSPGARYLKRIAGEPNDQLLLSNEMLYINGKLTVISNEFGPLVYQIPSIPVSANIFMRFETNVSVPGDSYFLLGDNSTKSNDSRMFGSVPRQNIIGRVWFCYWPPQHMGLVR
jgi:signal peptidase I